MAGQLGAEEEAAPATGEAHVSASRRRLISKLRDARGDAICGALDDTSVVEIMVNPDGRLFVERLGQGMEMQAALAPGATEIIIGSVAHALQSEADADRPIISGELPHWWSSLRRSAAADRGGTEFHDSPARLAPDPAR